MKAATYTPQQARTWGADDLAKLNGKHIELHIDGWFARDGLVSSAHPGLGPTTVIEFDGGGSWTWATEATDAQIVVTE